MAAPNQPSSRKRLVYHLDTPFSMSSWPEVSSDDQDTILELLCSLLNPIGQHRRAHIKPSKGKRAASREGKPGSDQSSTTPRHIDIWQRPELSGFVDVGFNTITRGLESLSSNQNTTSSPDAKRGSPQAYSMVFVARGSQSAAFNCHFPKLIGAASQKLASSNNMRLIGFSKPCSDRLSSCLDIARVSSLAIVKDAPGSEALWAFVEKHVPPVDVQWLCETQDAAYKPTSIGSELTSVGCKRVKSEQKAATTNRGKST